MCGNNSALSRKWLNMAHYKDEKHSGETMLLRVFRAAAILAQGEQQDHAMTKTRKSPDPMPESVKIHPKTQNRQSEVK